MSHTNGTTHSVRLGNMRRSSSTIQKGKARTRGSCPARQSQQSQALQLKIHLLFNRLNKKRLLNIAHQQEKSPQSLSKSKTSKITFKNQRIDNSVGYELRQVKQKLEKQFEFQFEKLEEDYQILTEGLNAFLSQRQQRIKMNQQIFEDVVIILERMKEISLNLTLSPKSRKIYTQIISKKRKGEQKKGEQTPFRLSLTPFHKDNSLLISVKRSLEGQGAYNQTAKKSQKEIGVDYKSCDYFPSVTEHPIDKKHQKESSYKDFIKQTQENEASNSSFDSLENSISQKMRQAASNRSKYFQSSKAKVESCITLTEKLNLEIIEERKKCQNEWNTIENTLKSQLNSIHASFLEYQRSTSNMDRDRQEIFALMQQSIQDVLLTERKAYKSDHTRIIDNLHQVISIFQ